MKCPWNTISEKGGIIVKVAARSGGTTAGGITPNTVTIKGFRTVGAVDVDVDVVVGGAEDATKTTTKIPIGGLAVAEMEMRALYLRTGHWPRHATPPHPPRKEAAGGADGGTTVAVGCTLATERVEGGLMKPGACLVSG